MTNAATALETVELGAMVRSVAQAIAEAQVALDLSSMRMAEALGKAKIDLAGDKVNLLEIGFLPSFYQLVETTIEMKISISMTEESSSETKTSESTSETKTETDIDIGWFSVSETTTTTTTTSSVDARYASRFQYSTQASSAVTTRIVPVPPPPTLMEIARGLAAE